MNTAHPQIVEYLTSHKYLSMYVHMKCFYFHKFSPVSIAKNKAKVSYNKLVQ